MKKIKAFVVSSVVLIFVFSCAVFGSWSDSSTAPASKVTPGPTPVGDYWEPIVR